MATKHGFPLFLISLITNLNEQGTNKKLGLGILCGREAKVPANDIATDNHVVGVFIIREWRHSVQHFVKQDTDSPVVNSLVVTFSKNEFWSQILWRSTEGKCSDTLVKGISIKVVRPIVEAISERSLRLVTSNLASPPKK